MDLRAKGRAGFTLVELLIVVIILAVLAAIVVPQFGDSTDDAKVSALNNTLTNLRGAVDLYKQQHGDYPGALTAVPSAGCAAGTKGTGALQTEAALREQLTMYTDVNGGACSIADDTFKYGPYLRTATGQLPNNPVTETNAVVMSTTGDLMMTSTAAPGLGWKYDVITGKLIADDADFADR